jgi:hypothetical protein
MADDAYLPCWKVTAILSNMENMAINPTPEDASAALSEADISRSQFAGRIALPSYFATSIGTAVAVQIAATAFGLAEGGGRGWWWLVAGVTLFALVGLVQLLRFRQLNGAWLGGLASRFVGGTATAASVSYGLACAAAILSAFAGRWWLVVVCAVAGGVSYAVSGRRWLRAYQAEPAAHARGESAVWLGVLVLVACAGLVLLMALH